MKLIPTLIAALVCLIAPVAGQGPTASPESLAKLDLLVEKLVAEDQVVGAEVLVIQHGKSILHESYGWRDREEKLAMENHSVFCVRSMTKPLTGTAILMLAQDGALNLDDPVYKYLPYFDVDGKRDITIQHLLHHNGGFPMSLVLSVDALSKLDGIDDLARLGVDYELDFAPGTKFRYSDHGTDTLTAVIERVAKTSAAEFVQSRILEPLGMENSTTAYPEDHPLRARGCSKYAGAQGNWTAYWNTSQPSIFPFFLGSQSLYSSAADYARFADFWLQKGRVGERQLLDQKWIDLALTPNPYPLNANSGLPNTTTGYGSLMMLWSDQNGKQNEPLKSASQKFPQDLVAFGHNGSDGTHAWVFPKQDAIVLYFTQSRGTSTGMAVEEVLGEMFLGVTVAEAQTAPPREEYVGYYWEHDDDSYRAVVLDGDNLALEVPGKAVLPLTYIGEDRWKIPAEGLVLEFARSEAGEVVSYTMGSDVEYKFQPAATLPTGAEVTALVAKTHGFEKMAQKGTLRLNSTLEFPNLNMKGEMTSTYHWPDNFRIEAKMGPSYETFSFDGSTSWYSSNAKELAATEGIIAEQIRGDNMLARFSDLSQWHGQVTVIQQVHRANKDLLLVRTGGLSAPARTLFVDANSGRVLGEDNVTFIEGAGRMGQRLRFNDFREVEGMLIPFESKIRFSNPMLGTLESLVIEFELGVPTTDGYFQQRD